MGHNSANGAHRIENKYSTDTPKKDRGPKGTPTLDRVRIHLVENVVNHGPDSETGSNDRPICKESSLSAKEGKAIEEATNDKACCTHGVRTLTGPPDRF